jgi:hypothetical protein
MVGWSIYLDQGVSRLHDPKRYIMFKTSFNAKALRTSVFVSIAAMTLGSLTAAAQAFPVQQQGPAVGSAEVVQYYEDQYYPQHNPYGQNDHPGHPGSAGLYDCGPGGKNTSLSRKACGGNDRFRHLSEQY